MNALIIDFSVVVIANIFNLLITSIMLSRPKEWPRLEHYLGLINIVLAIPLTLLIAFYTVNGYVWWMIVLPGLTIIFLIVELFLDYIYKSDFRQTRWLGLYLLLFYAAQWGMIGFGFGLNLTYGFVTLGTYFLSLGATAYSYAKVGHGKNEQGV